MIVMHLFKLRPWVIFGVSVCWTASGHGREPIDFERDVRPIFNRHCVACHGGVKQAADLSFIDADGARWVVEPGDAEASLLIERVEAEDDRMPPPEHGPPLSGEEIETLRRWISDGGRWGVHWAFEPPREKPPAEPSTDGWSGSRIDRFVRDRLREAGLSPAPPAAPERWLRRVSLDLVGLPPTPNQRSRFLSDLADCGERAYGAAVDRLLSSPAFGERWASVWLDAVRYADSRGLGQDGRRTVWKYRDWVIRAINSDMPYDEFTVRQLAGDLLPDPSIDDLVATTCQRLTQTNEEGGTDDEMFRVEAVVDRVNTLWQTWQGVSFGCVQCHSHPYDPIEHEEYYRFLAFYNNTVDCDLTNDEPTLRVPRDLQHRAEARSLDRRITRLWRREWGLGYELLGDASKWQALEASSASTNNATRVVVKRTGGGEEYQTRGTVAKQTTVTVEGRLPEGIGQLTAIRFTGLPRDETIARKNSEWGFVLSHVTAELVSEGDRVQPVELAFVIADEPDPILDPQLSLNPKSRYGFGAYSRIHHPRSVAFVLETPLAVAAGDRLRVSLGQHVFELGAFPLVAKRGRIAVSGSGEFHRLWDAPDRRSARGELAELRQQRRSIPSVEIPVMAERPASLARPSFVFDRGNYLTKTDEVTPATPAFLPPIADHREDGLDRLDLARWIASPENPLTARVAVNRVWSQLFGVGLVETQEDFGSAGSRPSHPRLLDDLAARFQTDMRWSLKRLLRELVLSASYRQSPRAAEDKRRSDPRNRLLSRGPDHRLSAETIRDQALAIGGLLSRQRYGPPVHPPIPEGVWNPFRAGDRWETPPAGDADRYRRTLYTYTKRSIPYPVMAAFDAPSREFCSVRRLRSNTPLQALMTLNDATFVEAAAGLARRMAAAGDDPATRLRAGFLLAVCREPSDAELAELLRLLERTGDRGERHALETAASVLLNLDEVLTR